MQQAMSIVSAAGATWTDLDAGDGIRYWPISSTGKPHSIRDVLKKLRADGFKCRRMLCGTYTITKGTP